jgi:serine/threonine protein kinase
MIPETPAYMSPEQIKGDSNSLGPTTDIYAMGAICYELITGLESGNQHTAAAADNPRRWTPMDSEEQRNNANKNHWPA